MLLTITLHDEQTIMRLLNSRAEAGAALLDAHTLNWPEHGTGGPVRQADVDQSSSDDNILAQVYGSYDSGLSRLGLAEELAADYGFCACGEATVLLNRAWQMQLARRRG